MVKQQEVSHYSSIEPTNWHKHANVPGKIETNLKQEAERIYSNDHILSLSKSDRIPDEEKTVTKANNAGVEVYRTDSQPQNDRPMFVHVQCHISVGENNDDEEEMAIKTEQSRLRTENIQDRVGILVIGYHNNSNGLLNSESNDKKGVALHNLLQSLGDHLDSELLSLSLRGVGV